MHPHKTQSLFYDVHEVVKEDQAVAQVWSNAEVFDFKTERLFRYLQGHYPSRAAAIQGLTAARQSGFADAFVVAYRGSARITLDEADQALKP